MKDEVAGLLRQMSLQETAVPVGWRLFMGNLAGRGVLVAQSGIGRERVERAAQFLLNRYPLSCLVSFGFAGALVPELKAGDLVIYREVVGPDPGKHYFSDPLTLEMAVSVGRSAGREPLCGCGLTLEQPVSRPDEKGALGESFGAVAVDMESYWVAAMAVERRVPFLAVRAVSDQLSQSLPQFDRLIGAEGGALWRGALLHLATHPVDLAKLPSLYAGARSAAQSLTAFLRDLVPGLPHQLDVERYRAG